MKLFTLLFALMLLAGAMLAPVAHADAIPQPSEEPIRKAGSPEMWKFGLVGLAVAGFLIRRRL